MSRNSTLSIGWSTASAPISGYSRSVRATSPPSSRFTRPPVFPPAGVPACSARATHCSKTARLWSRSRRRTAFRPAGGRTPPRRCRGSCRMARHRRANCARRSRPPCAPNSGRIPRTCTPPSAPASASAATRWALRLRRTSGAGKSAHRSDRRNRRQLIAAGVTPERIYASNLCTMCRPEEFHSFRRDKEAAGRMHSFAGIR